MSINNAHINNPGNKLISIYFNVSNPNFKLCTYSDGATHYYNIDPKYYHDINLDNEYNSFDEAFNYLRTIES